MARTLSCLASNNFSGYFFSSLCFGGRVGGGCSGVGMSSGYGKLAVVGFELASIGSFGAVAVGWGSWTCFSFVAGNPGCSSCFTGHHLVCKCFVCDICSDDDCYDDNYSSDDNYSTNNYSNTLLPLTHLHLHLHLHHLHLQYS